MAITRKYNLSKIMKRAWFYFKNEQFSTFSECLKMSWSVEKTIPTIDVIYNKYYAKIVNHIGYRTNHCIESEELANDVFIKANRHLVNYNPDKANVLTWLITIANNIVIDFYRTDKSGRNVHVSDYQDADGNEIYQFVGSDADGERAMSNNDIAIKVDNAINSLKGLSKEIAVLHFLSDKKYEEIAHILSIPLGTVKGTINRVRKVLQNKLSNVAMS